MRHFFIYAYKKKHRASNLFECQLGEPSVLQQVLALGGRCTMDLKEQVVSVEAAVLTDALLHFQHLRAHVRLAGAQLEFLLTSAGQGEKKLIHRHWSQHNLGIQFQIQSR